MLTINTTTDVSTGSAESLASIGKCITRRVEMTMNTVRFRKIAVGNSVLLVALFMAASAFAQRVDDGVRVNGVPQGVVTTVWPVTDSVTFELDALGTTSTDAINAENPTAATLAVPVQMSPRLRLTGYGWDTDDTVSRPVRFFTEVLPASAATVTGTWKLGYKDPITGAETYPLTVASGATNSAVFNANNLTLAVGGQMAATSVTAYAAGSWNFVDRFKITAPADGQLILTNAGVSVGIGLDVTKDTFLAVRTRAQTGYGSVDALAYRTTAYSSGARATSSDLMSVTEAVTLTGATTATAAIIPAGATVEGIATTTTTTITGATGYQVGDGADADRYGDITGTAVGTVSSSTNYTADPRWWTTGARAVTLTAKTSNFTAGVVQVTVFYRNATGT